MFWFTLESWSTPVKGVLALNACVSSSNPTASTNRSTRSEDMGIMLSASNSSESSSSAIMVLLFNSGRRSATLEVVGFTPSPGQ